MSAPVDFAFEHFGKHVAPEGSRGFSSSGKLGWLRTPGLLIADSATGKSKAGDRSPSMDGTVVYISESEVKVFGRDYRDVGFHSAGVRSEGIAYIERKWMQIPEEDWLAVAFGKKGVRNERGLQEGAHENVARTRCGYTPNERGLFERQISVTRRTVYAKPI